jgi:hypothetical protein
MKLGKALTDGRLAMQKTAQEENMKEVKGTNQADAVAQIDEKVKENEKKQKKGTMKNMSGKELSRKHGGMIVNTSSKHTGNGSSNQS